ncbi:hypothetical protein EV102420_36_00060 [Pseudescherichia vulneris NBRC 102420]|uniref:Ead/Ea22-like family protein n=1 Tax=Pseudescherichia vulneris NBRC 102420 TaxID=1115515 RepID=A0A090V6A0_PSEVU|nr:hypothetical protein [Pseudescherichia vulneris]GAL60331.1 hypothetical protein EV102420_36_00060 [Pseudescherichia vulneris NBRC 102420]STQ59720.1 phage protein [Pseudescherichia vulneris]
MSDKYAVLASYAQHMVDTGRDVAPFTSQEIVELVAALGQAEQRIAELEKWVRGVEESMISASDRAEAAEKRVAELERRRLTVKLPQGYVIRAGHPINEGERHVMVPKDGGDWLSSFDVEHALLEAGVSVEEKG